jgi:hypothetical protein
LASREKGGEANIFLSLLPAFIGQVQAASAR